MFCVGHFKRQPRRLVNQAVAAFESIDAPFETVGFLVELVLANVQASKAAVRRRREEFLRRGIHDGVEALPVVGEFERLPLRCGEAADAHVRARLAECALYGDVELGGLVRCQQKLKL